MVQTKALAQRRFELVAAEFLARMGARIRARREELRLTRGDVVRSMPGRVSENQLYRWENGQHQPNPDTLEALAQVLQTTVAEFMAPTPDKTETPAFLHAIDGGAGSTGDVNAHIEKILQRLDAMDAHLDALQALNEQLVAGQAKLFEQLALIQAKTPAAATGRRRAS